MEVEEESIAQLVALQLFVEPLSSSRLAATSKLSGLPCNWLPLSNSILSPPDKPALNPSGKKRVHAVSMMLMLRVATFESAVPSLTVNCAVRVVVVGLVVSELL